MSRQRQAPEWEAMRDADALLRTQGMVTYTDTIKLLAASEKLITQALNANTLPAEREHQAMLLIGPVRRALGLPI